MGGGVPNKVNRLQWLFQGVRTSASNSKLTWENVQLTSWNVIKRRLRLTKVLRQDTLWDVSEPVREEERGIFIKVTAVEDEQEFSAVDSDGSVFFAKSLDRVGVPSGEVPEVTGELREHVGLV